MKKTLIAAGIAAVIAAPVAMADVKISGVVEQNAEFAENAGTAGWDSDNSLTFAASEDLGNGLTAFASITFDTDKADTTSANGKDLKDEKVGLKGSFGTVVFGRMEDFTRSKIASKMTFVGAGGAAGEGLETDMVRGANRGDNAIAYVSPTFNGLHFGVATYENNANDIAIFYDNGPLSLAASRQVVPDADGDYDETTVMLAASYTMGDLKATIVRGDVDDHGNLNNYEETDMAYRLDYKMGNNTFSVGFLDDEDGAANGGTDAGDITVIEAVHALSKRTGVSASYMAVDNTTTTTDTFNVGVYHKF
jgi:predicted porin